MHDELSRLFDQFDRGQLSRRHLLKALGFAVAISPAVAMARGQSREGSAPDTTPAKLPFARTGWKTVRLDSITCEVADHEKEAAFYNALMNWGVLSDNGSESVLEIGDWGTFVIRGGYQPSAETVAAERQRYEQFQSRVPADRRQPFKPAEIKVTSFSWGIEPWNAKTVEAELKKRGLEPVAEHHGGFESFRVKDPDGFDLQISNGRWNPRARATHASLKEPAPFAHTDWKTVWLDHISFGVPDYKRSVAFYEALLGWTPGKDIGNQNQCQIGEIGDIIIRTMGRPGAPVPKGANIDHLSFGIAPFDPDAVKAELEKRGLRARVDSGTGGVDIHKSVFQSYHTTTPSGFDLQISNVHKANREASAIATVTRPGR
ncbi:MAG TPA: VOC family protein [Vicinamibacterales bacterium]|nr:VOC family protein [Vicinamibacterales bacterium]